MKLILTRKTSNPTCTIGELTSEDGQLRLITKEGKIPKDRQGYIMWCLPPGEYPMEIEYCCITYKDKPIRAYWPVLKKVPWFPKAGFYTGSIMAANKGCIKLGTQRLDDYQISGDDEACQQLVQWSKTMYGGNSETQEIGNSETLALVIIQNDSTIQFSNVNEHDYRIAEKLAMERQEQEELTNDLYGNLIYKT